MQYHHSKNLSDAYDKVSEKVTNSDNHYDYLEHLTSAVITDNNIILDAGCDNGYLIERVIANSSHRKNLRFEAFDASEKMVRELQQRLKNIIVSQQFLPDTSFKDKTFNVIMLSEVLEHVHAPRKALKELFRITAPKGILILSVPNGDRVGINNIIKKKKAWQPADDVFYTFSELNMMLREAGWRIASVDTIGWIFPRRANDGIMEKIVLRSFEWLCTKLNIFAMRRKTIVIVARKDDYLAFSKID